MNKQVKGLIYFYISDIRHSLIIFWSILLFVLVVALAFSNFLLGVEDGKMAFGFPFAIYFYCGILGYMFVKEYIPFAIKSGATRKNIYISIGIFFFSLVAIKTLVANTIQEIVEVFLKNISLTNFHFLHPAMAFGDTWINRVLVDICIMFFLFTLFFTISLVFYKFGLVGGGVVSGVLVLALLLGIAKGWVFDFIVNLVNQFDIVFFYQVFGVGTLLFLLSYLFIRRITIEKRR